jgi:hypothetical protein
MNLLNIYLTNKQELLVVTRHSTLGWQFTVVKNDGNVLKFVYTTHGSNIYEVTNYLSIIFNSSFTSLSDKSNTNSSVLIYDESIHGSIILDKDLSVLTVNFNFINYKLSNTDLNDKTLEEYMRTKFVLNFDLNDSSFTSSQSKNKNILDAQFSWSQIDSVKHYAFNNYGLSNALYNEIKNSDTFQTIISYINAIDPISPYKNILLKGPRASGKTTLVQAVAKYYDLPYAVLTATNRKTVDDIGGMLAPNESTSGWKKEEAHLATVLKAGGVAFIDELNMSTYDFQVGGLNSILDGSRFFTFYNESFKVHNQTIFFAAMNEGYQGNMILNESTESRFLPIYMDKISIEKVAEYQSKELNVPYDDYLSFVSYIDKVSQDISKTFEEQNTVYPYAPEINPRLVSKIFTMSKLSSFSTVMPQIIRAILSDPCYSRESINKFLEKYKVEFKSMDSKSFFVDESFKDDSELIFKTFIQTNLTQPTESVDLIKKVKSRTDAKFKELFNK